MHVINKYIILHRSKNPSGKIAYIRNRDIAIPVIIDINTFH